MADNNKGQSGSADKPQSQSTAQTDTRVQDKSRSASNPSLPPRGSDVPHDGRTATAARHGAPSSPASGKPTQAPDGNSASAENQSNQNAGMGAQVIGSTPDPATKNQLLSGVMGDIEAVLGRVQSVFGTALNVKQLEKHLLAARDWAAKELGLERAQGDAGWVAAGSAEGNVNQPAATRGQTEEQAQQSRKAAQENERAVRKSNAEGSKTTARK